MKIEDCYVGQRVTKELAEIKYLLDEYRVEPNRTVRKRLVIKIEKILKAMAKSDCSE